MLLFCNYNCGKTPEILLCQLLWAACTVVIKDTWIPSVYDWLFDLWATCSAWRKVWKGMPHMAVLCCTFLTCSKNHLSFGATGTMQNDVFHHLYSCPFQPCWVKGPKCNLLKDVNQLPFKTMENFNRDSRKQLVIVVLFPQPWSGALLCGMTELHSEKRLPSSGISSLRLQ